MGLGPLESRGGALRVACLLVGAIAESEVLLHVRDRGRGRGGGGGRGRVGVKVTVRIKVRALVTLKLMKYEV